MASGPASEPPRRHGLLRRAGAAVRGFAVRTLPVHRLLRRRRRAAPVGADVVGALPVRPPWTALTWLRFHRSAGPSTDTAAVDTRPGRVARSARRAMAMRRGEQAPPIGSSSRTGLVGATTGRSHAHPGALARSLARARTAGPSTGAGAGPFGIGLLSGGLPGGSLFGPAGVVLGDAGAARSGVAGSAATTVGAFGRAAGSAPAGPARTGSVSLSGAVSGAWPAGSAGAGAAAGSGFAVTGSLGSARFGPAPPGSIGARSRAAPGPGALLAVSRGLRGRGSAAHSEGSPGHVGAVAAGLASPVRRLATAPVPGPSVSAPVPAGSLPVLGGSSAPIAAPDPSGAVSATPPPASPVGASPMRARTPRERWEAAVAARPLETPRALPAAFHAMAREITRRAYAPRYTTGPATRQALSAAGALGATTGTVVHLPATPTTAPSSMSVLAHELTHARQPVRRPRFFLGGLTAHLDDDERGALAAGRRMLGGAVPAGPTVGSGLPSGLPVAPGSLPGAGNLPGLPGLPGAGNLPSLPGAGNLPSLPALPSLPSAGNLPSLPSLPTAASVAGASGLAGLPGEAGAAARNVVDESSAVGAGLVERLPVGGGVGAVADMAQTTARQTVLAAMPGGGLPNLGGMAGDASAWAQSTAGGLAGEAGSAAGDAADWAQGAYGQAQGAAGDLQAGAQNLTTQAQGAVGQAQNAVGGITQGVTGAAGAAGAAAVDPDKIVEMVEERLLREIERRGGRWAGVF